MLLRKNTEYNSWTQLKGQKPPHTKGHSMDS